MPMCSTPAQPSPRSICGAPSQGAPPRLGERSLTCGAGEDRLPPPRAIYPLRHSSQLILLLDNGGASLPNAVGRRFCRARCADAANFLGVLNSQDVAPPSLGDSAGADPDAPQSTQDLTIFVSLFCRQTRNCSWCERRSPLLVPLPSRRFKICCSRCRAASPPCPMPSSAAVNNEQRC